MARQSAHRLCKLEDLPKHLQFNKDIWGGYRRPMSAADCLRSLKYLHNESFNCYSHALGLLYFVAAARDYLTIWPPPGSSTAPTVLALILGDFVCSLLPFIFSIVYHTFMPHHSGERTYKQLLKMDVFGVWWCCTLGPISNVYTGLYNTPGLMVGYFTLYSTFSCYVLYYLMVVDCKRKRVGALTAQFFVRLLIHALRLSPLSTSSTDAVKFYIAMDAISSVGAVINALHIPERWFPGKLDYVLNSHTLMHVTAVVSIMVARQGFLCDMAWLNQIGTKPGNENLGLLDGLLQSYF